MRPSLFILIILLLGFAVAFDPNLSQAASRNIYGVKKFSSTRMAGTKKLSKRSFTNSSSLYGVRKSTSSSRLFGGLRNNYFGSGIFNSTGGSYNKYQYEEPKQKTACYGEARSLCNSM